MTQQYDDVIIPDPPGVVDSTELRVLRNQTTHFINENPEDITLLRGGTRTSDGAGGWSVAPGPAIPTQTFRLIIQQKGENASRNIDGEDIHPEYVLIGQWDASIENGDVFIKDERNYEVMFVRDDRRYETWAEVVYRG